MTDIWVCGTCHSINRQRNAKCYKCGAKQDMSASGPLADLRTERALIQRAARPYRSSLFFALIAGAAILVVAVLGIILLNESVASARFIRDRLPAIVGGTFDERDLAQAIAPALVPALARTVAAGIALLAFAIWLSRVISNIPALGGGQPSASSTRAFVAPFIPIYNLVKVPPLIQEAMYRTDPRAGGFFMIAIAWVGLVGSAVVAFLAGWWIDLRIASIVTNATTVGQAIDELSAAFDVAIIVEIVTTLMISFGAVVLVFIMLRIESRARARDREIRRGIRGMIDREAADRDVAPASRAAPAAALAMPERAPASPVGQGGSSVAATTLGTSPTGRPHATVMGPRLRLTVSGGTFAASLDDDIQEAATLDELREAGRSLAEAGGTATVVVAGDGEADDAATAAELAAELVTMLRAAGVPTTLE